MRDCPAMVGILALIMTLTVNPSIKSFWNLLIYSAFSFDGNVNKSAVKIYPKFLKLL